MSLKCFMVEPADAGEMSLRRFTFRSDKACPAPNTYGHEGGRVAIGHHEGWPGEPNLWGEPLEGISKDDPRWPKKCERCDYVFQPDDEWQPYIHRKFRRVDTGELLGRVEDLPAGSMWFGDWGGFKGPDGRSLYVKLPDGTEWNVDGPATNGPEGRAGWTRSGTPPLVTARPSIRSPRYHGFLTNGVLEPCGDSETGR